MADHAFDLVVLGAGSGGYSAAIRAVELGMTVALIEKSKVGGTCLHVGCIPTKAMLHAAEVADSAKEAHECGIQATFNGVDIDGVNAFRENIIAKKYKGLQGLIKARGITLVEGEGRLTSANTVTVNGDNYVGKNIVLATGSYSRSLPGLEIGGRVITSEQALQMNWIPRKVAILGGGVIGVEFASVWLLLRVTPIVVSARSLMPLSRQASHWARLTWVSSRTCRFLTTRWRRASVTWLQLCDRGPRSLVSGMHVKTLGAVSADLSGRMFSPRSTNSSPLPPSWA